MSRFQRKSSRERGYTSQWEKARKAFLSKHPLCVYCRKVGKVTAANVVDHIIPHAGSVELFWDQANWQALCTRCHSSVKQSEENQGFVRGSDATGMPLDPAHLWNDGKP